ncbi:MAG: hypothetical protein Udaeo_15990 [Candidatus Udaeobacter sp.]|nr:MAG: hypothetical protein Udaeo_15990 [Candidatus Udaeobacter sp.]
MRARLVIANRRRHLGERQSTGNADSERRHQVLDVMQPGQLRVSQAQDGLTFIDDCAVG